MKIKVASDANYKKKLEEIEKYIKKYYNAYNLNDLRYKIFLMEHPKYDRKFDLVRKDPRVDFDLFCEKLKKQEKYIKKLNRLKSKFNKKISVLEEQILNLIDCDKNLLTTVDVLDRNLGMICANYRLAKVVDLFLDNKITSKQCDYENDNLGMYAARNKLEQQTIKALKDKDLATMQNNYGENIGMIAAFYDLETATLMSLDNKTASLQQNRHGLTIGMISAKENLKEATLKALENKDVLLLKDKNGWDIEMHAYKITKDKKAGERIKKYEKMIERKRLEQEEKDKKEKKDKDDGNNDDWWDYSIFVPPVMD